MAARTARALQLLALAVLALQTAGCVRGCPSSRPPIHPNPNMDYQEKYEPLEESRFFYDGMTQRRPVPGTVPRGGLRESVELYTGRDANGEFVTAIPMEVDEPLLARGAERYAIYCAPCHDTRGTGRGIVYEYAGVPTASFHDEQRLGYPVGRVFDVITNGSGLMTGYGYPISPPDRWAIVAHVRVLQEQQTARVAVAAGR
jgi:mono/diheme cytochrome c family protein